jgi:hypothetical protein
VYVSIKIHNGIIRKILEQIVDDDEDDDDDRQRRIIIMLRVGWSTSFIMVVQQRVAALAPKTRFRLVARKKNHYKYECTITVSTTSTTKPPKPIETDDLATSITCRVASDVEAPPNSDAR